METKDYPAWVNNFITFDAHTREFIAWDECQYNELHRASSYEECADHVLEHADSPCGGAQGE